MGGIFSAGDERAELRVVQPIVIWPRCGFHRAAGAWSTIEWRDFIRVERDTPLRSASSVIRPYRSRTRSASASIRFGVPERG
jgi:hypothetical protein